MENDTSTFFPRNMMSTGNNTKDLYLSRKFRYKFPIPYDIVITFYKNIIHVY